MPYKPIKFFAHRRNKLVILVAITLISLGTLLVMGLLLTRNMRRPNPTLTLHRNADAPAVTYNDVPIIEACNIVSLDELRDKGVKLKTDSYPATFGRTYLEGGKGPAPLPRQEAIRAYPNSCHYTLQKDADWFDIAIYQASYNDMRQLEDEIAATYDPQPNIGDLQVYKAKTYRHVDEDFFNAVTTNKGNEDFILKQGDTALWFRLSDFKPAVREDVLRLIAANFSRLLNKPEARVTLSYSDFSVQGKLYKACGLLTAKDASLLWGQDISPVVEESYSSIPTREHEQEAHVAQRCKRSGATAGESVDLELRQFASEEGAKQYLQREKVKNSKWLQWQLLAVDLGGNETYIETNDRSPSPTTGRDTIYIRKGASVLAFSYHANEESEPSAYRTTEQLEPVITKVLERIK